jgi:hypothetical protein
MELAQELGVGRKDQAKVRGFSEEGTERREELSQGVLYYMA